MRLQAGEGNWLKRGTVELLGLIEIFCILIIVVTCLYICQNSANYILKIGDYSYRFWVVRLGFESWGSLRFFSILPICLILPNWQGRFHGTLTRQPALVKCFLHGQAQLLSCSTWFIFLAWNFCHYFLEPNAGQIQEGIGEAVNNIVKHFHKPEKEVWWAIKLTMVGF